MEATLRAEFNQHGSIPSPVVLTFDVPPPAIVERSDDNGRTWAPVAGIATKAERFEDWECAGVSRIRYRIMRPDGSRTTSVPVTQT